MSSGRKALLIVAAIYVATLVWSALVLPERVPSHFDASGRADDWSSRSSMLLLWAVLGVGCLAGVPWVSRWAASGDGTLVNMPRRHKDYWFAPERREELRRRFTSDMELFASITGVLLVALMGATTWAAVEGRAELPWWLFVGLVGVYLIATAVWTVALLRSYRPPEEGQRA